MISLTCASCSNTFEKKNNEYNRLRRKGREQFYCSLNCSGKDAIGHFSSSWNNSEANLQQLKEHCYVGRPLEIRPFYEYYRRCKMRCKKTDRGMTMNVDAEYLKDLWEAQAGRCALTNIPLMHGGNNLNLKASLDRKDSSIGYVKGNVQFVSCAINYAKSSESDSVIHDLVRLLFEHYPSSAVS